MNGWGDKMNRAPIQKSSLFPSPRKAHVCDGVTLFYIKNKYLHIIFPIIRNRITNRKMRRGYSSRKTGSGSSQSRTVGNWYYFWWSRFWRKHRRRRMGARVGRWCRYRCSGGDYGGPPSLCMCIRRSLSCSRRVPWFSNSRRNWTPRRRGRRRRLSTSFNSSKIRKLSKTITRSSRSHKSWKNGSRYTGIDPTNNLHTDHGLIITRQLRVGKKKYHLRWGSWSTICVSILYIPASYRRKNKINQNPKTKTKVNLGAHTSWTNFLRSGGMWGRTFVRFSDEINLNKNKNKNKRLFFSVA